MELKDLKIGMPVRYESQKWKGIVTDIRAAKFLLMLFIASIVLPGFAAAAEPGEIPGIDNITGPSTTTDVTSGLGVFAKMGKFLMDYGVHIAIFMMVLAIVVLSIRGSLARSKQRSEEASECRSNTKGLIEDGIYVMAALMFVFFILSPFVKSFIPT